MSDDQKKRAGAWRKLEVVLKTKGGSALKRPEDLGVITYMKRCVSLHKFGYRQHSVASCRALEKIWRFNSVRGWGGDVGNL